MNEKTNNPQEQSDFRSLLRHGSALLHRGKAQEAIPYLQHAYAIEPQDFDASLNLSGAYILTKKFRQAVEILEKLRQQAPNNVMVWTNLGAAYLGNPVLAADEEQLQAIAAFKKALTLDPNAPNVAYNIGLIHRDRKEFAEAIAWFKEALQANPKDGDARRLLAQLEQKNGRS